MRLWSTRESVRDGEPTLLAIAETLFAMAAYVWIGVRFGTWWHVWTAAMIAPFMLLRTDDSVERGWRIARSLRAPTSVFLPPLTCLCLGILCFLPGMSSPLRTWSLFAASVVIGIALYGGFAALLGRFAGAAAGFFLAPIDGLAAIPANWWRQTMCTDFRRSPELIPHPQSVAPADGKIFLFVKDRDAQVALYHVWGVLSACYHEARRFGRERSSAMRILAIACDVAMLFSILVGCVLPAVAFRLSVKATAIIWLPLIWAVQPPKPRDEPWHAYLKLKTRSDLMRLVVFISCLTLMGFIAKYLLLAAEQALATHEEAWRLRYGDRLGDLFITLVRPGEIPLWQVLSATNAALYIAMFLMMRRWLLRAEVGLPLPEPTIDRTLATCCFFRRLFTPIAIVNNLVVFYYLASKLPLPRIGTKLFRWL